MRWFILAVPLAVIALAFQNLDIYRTDFPEHPYDIVLARPTADSITISLLSYADREGHVMIGTDADRLVQATADEQFAAGAPAYLPITNLSPNTRYYYRLRLRAANGTGDYEETPLATFHTQRPPGSEFTFLMQADSHLDNNTEPELYAQSMKNMLAEGSDFLVDLGDTFMTDKYPNYTDAHKQYLAQRYYFGLLCQSAPLFITLGNHDGEQGRFLNGTSENMTIWSIAMRKKYFPNPEPDTFYSGNTTPDVLAGPLQNCFAWQWGDAHFIVLDPFWNSARVQGTGAAAGWSWTLGEAQYRWLKQTLESSTSRYKFLFIHHLVGGADSQRGGVEAASLYEWGGHDPDGSRTFAQRRPGWAAPIHELLVANKATAVFHGHDHLYVKQDLDGIVYQEVPQPGFPRYNQATSAAEYGYKSGTILGSPGYIRVKITPERATFDYLRTYLLKDENANRRNREISHSYEVKEK